MIEHALSPLSLFIRYYATARSRCAKEVTHSKIDIVAYRKTCWDRRSRLLPEHVKISVISATKFVFQIVRILAVTGGGSIDECELGFGRTSYT